MRFDLHVHTHLSDCSRLDPSQLVETAKSIGLDGLCITDHHTMAIHQYMDEGRQPNGLVIIFGMEYATADGDFLLFGPFEQLKQSLSAVDLLEMVARQGGAAVAAHPFRQGRSVSESIVASGLCRIVESVNGRNTDLENSKLQGWRERYPLIEVAGSDAHGVDEIGRAVTRIETAVTSRLDLISALQTGACRPESLFHRS